MALRKLLVAHILGSPLGGAVAARRLRGQPASASTQPMRGGRWQLALSVLANARPLSPAGSGDAAQWAASSTDRRGSGDQALNGAHWAPAPPGEGFLRKTVHRTIFLFSCACWRYKTVGRCPFSAAASGAVCQWQTSITDRRGSGDQALDGAHWAPAPLPAFFRESWAKNFTRLRRSHPVCTAT